MQTVSKLLKPLSFLRVSPNPNPLLRPFCDRLGCKAVAAPLVSMTPVRQFLVAALYLPFSSSVSFTAYYTTRLIQRKKYLLQSAFDNFSMTTIHVTEDFR